MIKNQPPSSFTPFSSNYGGNYDDNNKVNTLFEQQSPPQYSFEDSRPDTHDYKTSTNSVLRSLPAFSLTLTLPTSFPEEMLATENSIYSKRNSSSNLNHEIIHDNKSNNSNDDKEEDTNNGNGNCGSNRIGDVFDFGYDAVTCDIEEKETFENEDSNHSLNTVVTTLPNDDSLEEYSPPHLLEYYHHNHHQQQQQQQNIVKSSEKKNGDDYSHENDIFHSTNNIVAASAGDDDHSSENVLQSKKKALLVVVPRKTTKKESRYLEKIKIKMMKYSKSGNNNTVNNNDNINKDSINEDKVTSSTKSTDGNRISKKTYKKNNGIVTIAVTATGPRKSIEKTMKAKKAKISKLTTTTTTPTPTITTISSPEKKRSKYTVILNMKNDAKLRVPIRKILLSKCLVNTLKDFKIFPGDERNNNNIMFSDSATAFSTPDTSGEQELYIPNIEITTFKKILKLCSRIVKYNKDTFLIIEKKRSDKNRNSAISGTTDEDVVTNENLVSFKKSKTDRECINIEMF